MSRVDRLGWSILGAGAAATWIVVALVGGLDAVEWLAWICAWLALVAVGGMTNS